MAINPLGGAGPAGISGSGGTAKVSDSFSKTMKGQAGPARPENAPTPVQNVPINEAKGVQHAQPGKCKVGGAGAVQPGKQVTAAGVLEKVNQAQSRMEQILHLAESGKSFSPAELLSLQTHVYRASQELDLAGKVVEKATGGVKQVLQTQV